MDRAKPIDTKTEALSLVDQERNRQEKKWGQQNHAPQYWVGILGEEYGEYCQAVNETVFDNGATERKKGGMDNMIKELTHVAAVAVAAIESLLRPEYETPSNTVKETPESLKTPNACKNCWCHGCGNFEDCIVEMEGYDPESEPCPCDGCGGDQRYMPKENPPMCGRYMEDYMVNGERILSNKKELPKC